MLGCLEHAKEAEGMLIKMVMDAMEELIQENLAEQDIEKRRLTKQKQMQRKQKKRKKKMGILDTATKYEDFKYVIQDVGSVSLGAKYSYEDMLNEELIPFKFKSIINYYILKEADKSTTLESEFYYMEEGTFLYETYRQLKTKVKVRTQSVKRISLGKKR